MYFMIFNYVCECLSMYGYMYLITDAPGCQKKALHLLELELQNVGTWERDASPQQEQSMLITSKPPLQPWSCFYRLITTCLWQEGIFALFDMFFQSLLFLKLSMPGP